MDCREWVFLQGERIFLQKSAFSYRNMHFPAEICLFLQQNCRNCRKLQEGFRAQESGPLRKFHKNFRGLSLGHTTLTSHDCFRLGKPRCHQPPQQNFADQGEGVICEVFDSFWLKAFWASLRRQMCLGNEEVYGKLAQLQTPNAKIINYFDSKRLFPLL